MATYTRRPQRLADWLDAGNEIPPFFAGTVEAFLANRGVDVRGVSIAADGTVTAESGDTYQKVYANLDAMRAEDMDPDRAREQAYTGIMAQLDQFADAIEAGGPPAVLPSLLETQRALARLIRVAQFLAERRR